MVTEIVQDEIHFYCFLAFIQTLDHTHRQILFTNTITKAQSHPIYRDKHLTSPGRKYRGLIWCPSNYFIIVPQMNVRTRWPLFSLATNSSPRTSSYRLFKIAQNNRGSQGMCQWRQTMICSSDDRFIECSGNFDSIKREECADKRDSVIASRRAREGTRSRDACPPEKGGRHCRHSRISHPLQEPSVRKQDCTCPHARCPTGRKNPLRAAQRSTIALVLDFDEISHRWMSGDCRVSLANRG